MISRPAGCSSLHSSGWNWVPHHGRSSAAITSTAHASLEASTRNPSGSRVTSSSWLWNASNRGARPARSSESSTHVDRPEAADGSLGRADDAASRPHEDLHPRADAEHRARIPAERLVEAPEVPAVVHRPRVERAGEDERLRRRCLEGLVVHDLDLDPEHVGEPPAPRLVLLAALGRQTLRRAR